MVAEKISLYFTFNFTFPIPSKYLYHLDFILLIKARARIYIIKIMHNLFTPCISLFNS